jgi:hypothetical protein
MFKKLAILGATAAFLGFTLGGATLAGADELQPSDGTTTQAPVTVTPTASSTVSITLVALDDPGWNGDNHGDHCDVKNPQNLPGHYLNATVTSANVGVATVSPSTLEFTRCGESHNIVITGVDCGDTTVTVQDADHRTAGGKKAIFSDGVIYVHVGGCDGGPVTGIDTCANPAAPAWAVAILQVNGYKASAKNVKNLISMVAHEMLQGAAFPDVANLDPDFDVVAKSNQDAYATSVWRYLQSVSGLTLEKGPAEAKLIRPGWACTHADAV